MTTLRNLFLATRLAVAAAVPAIAAEPRSRVVAHWGLLRNAPENTLASFRACLELRVGFEFDVQRTKDGHLVCIHDDTVDQTTDGSGAVAELTLAEIRQLDAGCWFDPKFAGEKMPTVKEVLKLVAAYRQKGLLIAADLKAGPVPLCAQDTPSRATRGRAIQRPVPDELASSN
jgi:glycerophosphoryl diester phosphodiesterase